MKKFLVFILIVIIGYLLYSKNSIALEQEVSLQDKSLYDGKLILINQETKLRQAPKNLKPIPIDIASNVSMESEFWLVEDVIQPLEKMFKAAEEDGTFHFIINSAYRNNDLQHQLYNEYGSNYALPAGFSEHQSGLSLDIGSAQGTMDQSPEGEWLANNAAKFGFILRYPENKVDVTGISFEPWHFRYVGLPHSIVMEKENLVLEEYIQFLKEEQNYTEEINGIKYYVQYVEKTDLTKVPDAKELEISGDNLDGYILTSVLD